MATLDNGLEVGSTVSVTEQETATTSGDIDASVAIIGTYDSQNGSYDPSTGAETVELTSLGQAEELFGADSQLVRQYRLSLTNDARTIIAAPVETSEVTETFTGASTGTFSEPLVDSRFSVDGSISVEDTVDATSVSTTLVDGEVTSPSETNTANINPQTGEISFDTSSDYDVTATVGEYTDAIMAAVKRDVTSVTLCSANQTATQNGVDSVWERASRYDFKRFIAHTPTGVDPSDYTVGFDDQRLVLAAPTYGTTVEGDSAMLSPSVGSKIAAEGLAQSATKAIVRGFDSLSQEFTVDELTNFGEGDNLSQVTAVHETVEGYEIAEDLTTSTGEKFRDVYRCEIIDFITLQLHRVADEFIKDSAPNTSDGRDLYLETPARRVLRNAANRTPPLLGAVDGGEPFALETSGNPDNDEEATLRVGIDVVGVGKTVIIPIGVGAVDSFGGAN